MSEELQPDWRIPDGAGRQRGIGIIGAGGIVSGAHLPAYKAAGLNVVAIYDVDADKARTVADDFEIGTVAESAEALIAVPGVDIVDIAVPRDIHPDVSSINNVFVFGLDDLDEMIAGNLTARRNQLPRAEKILDEELEEFQRWLDDVDLRPTVAEFKAYLEELKDKQVGFVRKKQSDEIAAAVDRSLQQFIKKVLGRSVATLKSTESRAERDRDLDTLRKIFTIDETD